VYVKVRSVGVGGMGVCMVCASVIEEDRDNGEGTNFQELTRQSYARRYIEFIIRGKTRTDENTYKWVSV
jgi:hypothetical protein